MQLANFDLLLLFFKWIGCLGFLFQRHVDIAEDNSNTIELGG